MTEKKELKNLSPLLPLGLVVAVFLIQKGMISLRSAMEPTGNLLKLAVIANQVISIILPVLLFILLFKLAFKESLGFHKPHLIKIIITTVAGTPLMYLINYYLPRLIPPTPQFTQSTGNIISYNNTFEWLLTLLTISIIAPIADEMFFRGILLRFTMSKWGKIAAIIITSIITALFHPFEPFKLTHAFTMGVIFSSSVVWTGSIWAGIILHAIHNGFALI